MSNNSYCVEYAKSGRSKCKFTACEEKAIPAEQIRIGKKFPSAFGSGESEQTSWYHPTCAFQALQRARKDTKKIDSTEEIEGFDKLKSADRKLITKLLEDFESGKLKAPPRKRKAPGEVKKQAKKQKKSDSDDEDSEDKKKKKTKNKKKSDSDSDSDSESDESGSDSDEDTKKKTKGKAAAKGKGNTKAKTKEAPKGKGKGKSKNDSDSESEKDDSDSDSESEKKTKKPPPKAKTTKKTKKVSSSESESEKQTKKSKSTKKDSDSEEKSDSDDDDDKGRLKGKVFAISGTLSMKRTDVVKLIQKNGGTVASSITNAVTHVLCADKDSTTQKLVKAKKDGKKLVEEDFLDSYK